jgi:hypothetical protein
MMREKLITMRQAAAWLKQELGVVRSPITVWGWMYYGKNGVKLEAVSVAGRWHTTEGALRRFLSNCTRQHSADAGINVAELQV